MDGTQFVDVNAGYIRTPNFATISTISELQKNSTGNLRKLNNKDCVKNYNHEFGKFLIIPRPRKVQVTKICFGIFEIHSPCLCLSTLGIY